MQKYRKLGFSGGIADGSLPADAGDMGLILGPGGSHMPRSNYAHVPQLLSLLARALESQLWDPCAATTEARVL